MEFATMNMILKTILGYGRERGAGLFSYISNSHSSSLLIITSQCTILEAMTENPTNKTVRNEI